MTRARIDPATLAAFGCILVLLFAGSLYSQSFLSPEYLLQQLKVASFLGIIATGMMIVILLGQIDLSAPWAIAVGGMMSASASAWGPAGPWIAIPFGVACGVAIGLVNGFGVAYLRIPSMIVTLAVNAVAQGLMVVHTGGFSPQDFGLAGDALHRDRRRRVRPAQRADRLGGHRRRRDAAAQPHDVRPRGLRDRQPRARDLSFRRRSAAGDADRVHDFRRAVRVRGRAARGLCVQGRAGDGRSLSLARDRRRRAGRRRASWAGGAIISERSPA